MFSDDEKKDLLDLAKGTLHDLLHHGTQSIKRSDNSHFYGNNGVFVTIKKNGDLRGCKGCLVAETPLYETVQRITIDSATNDPRFSAITLDEYDQLSIDVSVMSPILPCENIDDIVVGKHGLIIQHGQQSGLLLPQVPIEWGWDRETYLIQICRKAGLPDDAWTYAQLSMFEAEVF